MENFIDILKNEELYFENIPDNISFDNSNKICVIRSEFEEYKIELYQFLTEYLKLQKMPQIKIKLFLELLTSPKIVKDNEDAYKTALIINKYIQKDNFIIKKNNVISQKDIYKIEYNSVVVDINFKTTNIKNNNITFENIKESIENAKKFFYEEKYEDSITRIRRLLEDVFLFILENEDIEYSLQEKGDLKKLFSKLKNILNFSVSNIKNKKLDEKLQNAFISLSGSLENIIGNIATISNNISSRHSSVGKPLRHHCLLCINVGVTLTQFILDVYQNKKLNKETNNAE